MHLLVSTHYHCRKLGKLGASEKRKVHRPKLSIGRQLCLHVLTHTQSSSVHIISIILRLQLRLLLFQLTDRDYFPMVFSSLEKHHF